MSINDRAELLSGFARQASNTSNTGKQAWSDLVKEYPDKWVIYTNQETVDDNRVFLCTVLAICDDNERSSILNKMLDSYKKVGSMRTTSNFNGAMGV